MKYLVIDEDGQLHQRETDDWAIALADVGPEGWNRVRLTRDLAAYVNDVGLVSDAYRRNVAAGLVLIALGANRIPYAGPVVLVGWDGMATYRGEVEVIGLTPLQEAVVTAVHHMVTEANGGVYAADVSEETAEAVFGEVQTIADMIANGPVPSWSVHTL